MIRLEPWIGFAARRYISGRKKDRSSSSVLAILGISTGVLALTVILAVMNGFQLGFIESILEISSYHIQIENFPSGERGQELLNGIQGLAPVRTVLPFREIQTLLRGKRSSPQVSVIRSLDADTYRLDSGMAAKLEFLEGSFDIAEDDSILLGAELSRRLAARPGDEINLMTIAGFNPENAEASSSVFRVMGIFRSGFYEYDLGWGFINNNAAEKLLDGIPMSLGIKLNNRWQDERTARLIERITVPGDGLKINTWRDYNRAFFGALRTEKLLMFILVGLIFIVVGLNIYQSQRRAVLERREEIGLLRAVGAGESAVRMIFAYDGFIIGALGATIGMTLGLLIAFNIGSFFSIIEIIVNGVINGLNIIAAPLTGGDALSGQAFSIFSPAVFYIKEVPSRVIPYEAALIYFFGLFSATAAAWLASGKISQIKPAEVLHYE